MGFMRDVRGIYGNSRGFMLDSWDVIGIGWRAG
jgi:hypothetical protein